MTRSAFLILCASLLSLLFFVRSGYAQGNLGAISGAIQDASGADVPDAAITNHQCRDTGVKWTAKTSSAGYYHVSLVPGTYRVQGRENRFRIGRAAQIVVPVAATETRG